MRLAGNLFLALASLGVGLLLPLDDKRWSKLAHAYGNATDIAQGLARLKADPTKAAALLKHVDLWGSLCHQSRVFSATFAAIPHLVDVAKKLPPKKRENILAFVGYSVACAALPGAPPIPQGLLSAYNRAIREGAELLAETLLVSFPAENYQCLLGAMAAMKGHADLCFVVSHLGFELRCPQCGSSIEPMKSNLNLKYLHSQGRAW